MRAAALVTVLALLTAPAAAAPHARAGKGHGKACKAKTSSASPIADNTTPAVVPVPSATTSTSETGAVEPTVTGSISNPSNQNNPSPTGTSSTSTSSTSAAPAPSSTDPASSSTDSASNTDTTATETGTDTTPAPSGSSDFPPKVGEFPDPTQAQIDEVLKAHNDERAKYGAAPLTWSADAAAAAKENVQTCLFAHTQTTGQGQNLAAGTSTSMTITDFINMWNDEEKDYNWDTMEGAGHWTQVVWKATTQVGCAWTTCASLKFPTGDPWTNGIDFACNYVPAGNMVEQDGKPGAAYKANVGPAV